MSKLDKDQVIAKFTDAYKAAHGKQPEIEAKGGWYSVDGGKNMRLAALDEMADELAAGQNKGKKAASEKKAESKDQASEKAPAKKATTKKSAPKKKKKSSGDFSVKAYWAEQLEKEHPGSRKPR